MGKGPQRRHLADCGTQFWSAATRRRFCRRLNLLLISIVAFCAKRKSGDESPHSKTNVREVRKWAQS